MNVFDLKTIGQCSVVPPTNLAICLELVSIWSSEPDRAGLFRICAAAIGVAVDGTRRLPHYRFQDGNINGYGGTILERLLEAGVTPSAIVEYGTHVLAQCVSKIPTEQDVEDTADFLAEPPAES